MVFRTGPRPSLCILVQVSLLYYFQYFLWIIFSISFGIGSKLDTQWYLERGHGHFHFQAVHPSAMASTLRTDIKQIILRYTEEKD